MNSQDLWSLPIASLPPWGATARTLVWRAGRVALSDRSAGDANWQAGLAIYPPLHH